MKEAVLLDVLFNSERMAPHPMALSLLRSFQPSQATEPSRNRAAFIRPGGDSRRAIANEGAIEDVMARHGIEVFGPDEIPLRTRVALWHGYDLLIATLGNDLTNMVYARPGTRVLVLSPDWLGESFFFELSMAAGVQWHELRCGEMVRGSEDEGLSSFHVDVDLLNSIVTSLLG